jgi:hypothetical protein
MKTKKKEKKIKKRSDRQKHIYANQINVCDYFASGNILNNEYWKM